MQQPDHTTDPSRAAFALYPELEAAQFVQIIEQRQGLKICCPEEIAYNNGFIDADQLKTLASRLGKNGYGDYLMSVLTDPTL